jgi:hypothetical protein
MLIKIINQNINEPVTLTYHTQASHYTESSLRFCCEALARSCDLLLYRLYCRNKHAESCEMTSLSFLMLSDAVLLLLQVASISQLTVSRLSRHCGILNISQPYRPSRPVTGIALLYGDGVCFL